MRSLRVFLLLTILVTVACSSSRKKSPAILEETPPAQEAAADTLELKAAPLLKSTMAEGVNWSYQGETGPTAWGTLDPSLQLCSTGSRQSPINLVYRKPEGQKEIIFDVRDSIWTLMERQPYFVIQPGRSNTTYFAGTSFTLKEVSFHTPAEHTFSGKRLPLEVNLYHESENGEVLIVSTMFQEGPNEHVALAQLLKQIPLADKKDFQVVEPLSLGMFLPEVRSYYHYMGSLTYPPCTEGIHRVVFNTPLLASSGQLAQLKALLGENSRPLQPLNKRTVENFASPEAAAKTTAPKNQ